VADQDTKKENSLIGAKGCVSNAKTILRRKKKRRTERNKRAKMPRIHIVLRRQSNKTKKKDKKTNKRGCRATPTGM